MNEKLRQDAELIARDAIQKVSPSQAVRKALEQDILFRMRIASLPQRRCWK